MNSPIESRQDISSVAKKTILAYLATTLAVLLLMMLFGAILRAGQAQILNVDLTMFYKLMTLHGAGMVGIAGLGGAAVMWYFLSKYVKLSTSILITNMVFFLLGVVLILGAVLIGDFAGGWTFLYPLPVKSMNVWGVEAAVAFLSGLLLIGVGFLLLYLDVGRALIKNYGGLARSLGWHCLFGKSKDFPPAAVVASTMVLIVNTLGILAGAVVLVISLINALYPAFQPDPLAVKSLIYFFGHVFINATIYMAVIAVYEILPVYTGRQWKVNKVFLAAWSFTTLMVVAVVPHHMLMDFNMPGWLATVGQIGSYISGIPVLIVTAYGALTIVHKSGIRWDISAGMLFISMYGWASGVVPAIIDATIHVNTVMHNTQWVPGHFHFYLLLGVLPMILGFMLHITKKPGNAVAMSDMDKLSMTTYLLAGVGFVMAFLYAGKNSVPRRWGVHLEEWLATDQMATIFAVLIICAFLVITVKFFSRLPQIIRN